MTASLLLRVHSAHVNLADLTQALSLSGTPHQLHAYDADGFPLGALHLCGDRVKSASHAGLSGADAFVALLHDPRVHHVDTYEGGEADAGANLPLASLLLLAMSQQPAAPLPGRSGHPASPPDEPTPAPPLPAPQREPRSLTRASPTAPKPSWRAQLDGWTILLLGAALLLALLLMNSLLHFL